MVLVEGKLRFSSPSMVLLIKKDLKIIDFIFLNPILFPYLHIQVALKDQ